MKFSRWNARNQELEEKQSNILKMNLTKRNNEVLEVEKKVKKVVVMKFSNFED